MFEGDDKVKVVYQNTGLIPRGKLGGKYKSRSTKYDFVV